MSNVIEFPIDRRFEQMAIEDGFTYEKVDEIEQDIDHFLGELLREMFDNEYRIDGEEYVCDVSFLYETLRSFVYKMNNLDHPIQLFSRNLYRDIIDPNTSQLEFDF